MSTSVVNPEKPTAPAPTPAAATRPGPLLETDKLVKEYNRRRVVNGVSIYVNAGEIVGLL